jgi:hypothetical protein
MLSGGWAVGRCWRGVENSAGLLTVGRGLPGGKFLSLSRQRKEPKKGDPDSPEFPKTKRVRRAAKNSSRLVVLNLFFVVGTQTPLPLIPPTHLIFGGSVRGKTSKPGR